MYFLQMSVARRSKKIKSMKYIKAYHKRATAMPPKAFRSKPMFNYFVYKTISETWKRNRRKAFRSRWVASLQYARPCGTKGPSCARTWVHTVFIVHENHVPQYLLLHAHTHIMMPKELRFMLHENHVPQYLCWHTHNDAKRATVYACMKIRCRNTFVYMRTHT